MAAIVELNLMPVVLSPRDPPPESQASHKADDVAVPVIKKLSVEKRTEIVHGVAEGIAASYVNGSIGSMLELHLKEKLKSGKYDAIDSPGRLSNEITKDVFLVHKDEHFGISIKGKSPAASLEEEMDFGLTLKEFQDSNFGIEDAYVVDRTNIGYLNLNFFAPFEFTNGLSSAIIKGTKEAFFSAMRALKNADGLIIDLRSNEGGHLGSVTLLVSCLMDDSHHLYTLKNIQEEVQEDFFSMPQHIPKDARFGGEKPIYVLIGPNTFSAAEACADLMQSHKRAVLIGQTTRGGAHGVQNVVINAECVVHVPSTRIFNPRTEQDWEGRGIKPDIVARPGQDACQMALNLLQGKLDKGGCCTIL